MFHVQRMESVHRSQYYSALRLSPLWSLEFSPIWMFIGALSMAFTNGLLSGPQSRQIREYTQFFIKNVLRIKKALIDVTKH